MSANRCASAHSLVLSVCFAKNSAYQILHYNPMIINVHSHQVAYFIRTFDALIICFYSVVHIFNQPFYLRIPMVQCVCKSLFFSH